MGVASPANGRAITRTVPLTLVFLFGCIGQVSPIPEFNAAISCVEGSMGAYAEQNRNLSDDLVTIIYSDVAVARRGAPTIMIYITIRGRSSGAVIVEGTARTGMAMQENNSVASRLVFVKTLARNVGETCTPPPTN